jgi:hypothetical protein
LKDEEKEGLLVIPYNYDCNGKKVHSALEQLLK